MVKTPCGDVSDVFMSICPLSTEASKNAVHFQNYPKHPNHLAKSHCMFYLQDISCDYILYGLSTCPGFMFDCLSKWYRPPLVDVTCIPMGQARILEGHFEREEGTLHFLGQSQMAYMFRPHLWNRMISSLRGGYAGRHECTSIQFEL